MNNEQQAGPYKVAESSVDGVATSWIENDEGRLDDGELAKRLNAQHRQIEEQAAEIKRLKKEIEFRDNTLQRNFDANE